MRRLPSPPLRIASLLLAALLAGCAGDEAVGEPARGGTVPVPATDAGVAASASDDAPSVPPEPNSAPAETASDAPGSSRRPVFRRPEHLRGLYLNAWTAGSTKRVEELLALARRTEVNAFVIDIKDASGYVSHDSQVELARSSGATGQLRIRDLPALLARLEAEGVYPIARIVIVQDPLVAGARPELAIQSTDGGVWRDGRGTVWLNPYHREVWDYHVALAREVAGMGFPEIQWDYVRFPDAPRSQLARTVFPHAEGRTKSQAIRGFLTYAREQLADLDVRVTADVFGVTTSAKDVGIGQIWEELIDVVDVALPMVYPSHYFRGSFGQPIPNARPYEIVHEALRLALRRSEVVPGAGKTVPWLQDFSLGQPSYGAPEVRAQIQATYDVGIEEWVLWNAGSRYTEAALEPDGGFVSEPQIRVRDRIVRVSERHEVMGTDPNEPPEAPQPQRPAPARRDTLPLLRAGAVSLISPPPSPLSTRWRMVPM